MSLDVMQYCFVAYDYDTNFIFAIPIANIKDATIVKDFDKVFKKFIEEGHKPALNLTNNQAVNPLKTYLKRKNCRWQFVEPKKHRVNASERSTQTFKNNFISGLSSTDIKWPLQLWDQLAHQAATTLNILKNPGLTQQNQHTINYTDTNMNRMHFQWPHLARGQ